MKSSQAKITPKTILVTALALPYAPYQLVESTFKGHGNVCPIEQSPLYFSWNTICPMNPPRLALVNKIKSQNIELLSQSYFILHNWPLSHTQLFLFGGTHENPFIEKLQKYYQDEVSFANAIEIIGKSGDTALYEGMRWERKFTKKLLTETPHNRFFYKMGTTHLFSRSSMITINPMIRAIHCALSWIYWNLKVILTHFYILKMILRAKHTQRIYVYDGLYSAYNTVIDRGSL